MLALDKDKDSPGAGKREELVTEECFFTENSIIATFLLCSWASLESNSGQKSICRLPFIPEAAIGNDDDDPYHYYYATYFIVVILFYTSSSMLCTF